MWHTLLQQMKMRRKEVERAWESICQAAQFVSILMIKGSRQRVGMIDTRQRTGHLADFEDMSDKNGRPIGTMERSKGRPAGCGG